MIWFLAGVLALVALLSLTSFAARMDGAKLAKTLRLTAGVGLAAAAVFLGIGGRLAAALPLGVLGFYFLTGKQLFSQGRIFPGERRTGRAESEARSPHARMSRTQAYRILNLPAGASEEDIATAYRELMKRVHPDHGGSEHFAAELNEARDVLLGDK